MSEEEKNSHDINPDEIKIVSSKKMMLDEICDPEPLSGYTLLDEIEFTLYSAQSEMNRLQKLIFLYKEQQE